MSSKKKEKLEKEVERLESIVQELKHGRVDAEPLLEQPTPPSKESRQLMELIERHSEEDEDVMVLAGPKDALRSQQAYNSGKAQ